MKRAVVLVLVLAFSAHAETLGDLLKATETNNLDRQIALEQRKKAAADMRVAWTSLLPNILAQASWTRNQYPVEINFPGAPKITITPENQYDGILRAELPLLDTTRWFRTAAASAANESAEFRDLQVRNGVVLQTASTYYLYAAALAVRDSAKRSLAVAEAQLKLTDIRLQAGSVTELDLLRARAEFARNKQTVADSEVLVANLKRSVRTLTGIELDEKAALPPENLNQEGTIEQLEAGSEGVPAVLAAESDKRGAEHVALAAKLGVVPQLTGNFTERFTNATGFSGHSAQYTAGIGLLWHLDGPTIFNMQSQNAQAQIANLALQRQKLISRDQVHTDFERLQSAIEKVTDAQTQVESAKRAAQIARDRYAVGAATQIDMLQAERDLFGAEVNQIQARTELASSHLSLRISAGLPIEVQ